ncbi:MAG TPA: hypothetical protein VFA85_07150 [Terriglobales bacterium]|nr:hypothetical protein [Terriglobales bacterium]
MKYVLIALLTAVVCFAQQTPSTGASDSTTPSSSIPVDQANAAKARAVLDQAIKALGGDAYLNWKDISVEGRSYSFHHGEANSVGTIFWRFRKFPDKDRIEITKKRDIIQIYNGDKGYEITYKGIRNLEGKDDLQPYLRRRKYSLDIVLRTWLNQPGVALFYDGQTVAAQKQTDQVTVMNSKNEAVTIYIDINSHLPVAKSYKWRDPVDNQRNEEEEIFDNYRRTQNIMTAYDTTRLFNGEMSAQAFLTDAKYNQNLEDSLFDPEAATSKENSKKKR